MNIPNLDTLSDITFIFDAYNWTCAISIKGGPEHQLIKKGKTNKEGVWYQLDDNLHHWISFNQDKFNNSKIEAFYKRPQDLNNILVVRQQLGDNLGSDGQASQKRQDLLPDQPVDRNCHYTVTIKH